MFPPPRWWRPLCRWQFVLLLVIFTYYGLTTSSGAHVPQYNDKWMHFAGYLVAGVSVTLALPAHPVWQRFALLALYSTGIEVAQHFNPPRTFSLGDIVANLGGASLGLCTMVLLRRCFPTLERLWLQ